MLPPTPITTDIVLLGAGHAHVEVLRRFALRPEPGIRLTLITREPHTPYSGMLPGLLRGDYEFDQAHIDTAPLAIAARARLIMAEARAVDLAERRIILRDRPSVAFDVLSIDVGGIPAMAAGDGGTPVKPIGGFLQRLADLEATLAPGARIAVVGGGAAGTELALALARRLRGIRIALVADSPEPLPTAPERARRLARAALAEECVELTCGVQAGALRNGALALSDGSFIEAAAALWATNVVGPTFLGQSGLACDEAGCVRVGATLQSVSHPFVFAAGDCAALDGAPRPKAGVWAVRAGVPLAANLRRAAAGRSLRRWRPQNEALTILGLGGGRAIAWRNGVSVSGHWVWRWKDWIDRRWMRMFAMRMRPAPGQEMRCGGCGAKVGAGPLAAALSGLVTVPADGEVIGLAEPDDAAVLRPPPGLAVVQSVDHFRAFIDDPFLFGEIAAAHALSDIYAMGARPWTALAIAAVTALSAEKMGADLRAMMEGAAGVLQADGCALVGGHSAEGAEPGLGFAVTGLAEPRRVWRKSGLRDGDALVLTKPLGTGIVLAGHMRGLAKARWLEGALASMRATNAAAARVFRSYGVVACTDISGFGLVGHLTEMLSASRMGAAIRVSAVPLLPGVLELSEQGVASTLLPENRRALPEGMRGTTADIFADPQTSGGLLAGVRPERVSACIAALHAAGIGAAAIGVVEAQASDDGEPDILRLRQVRNSESEAA